MEDPENHQYLSFLESIGAKKDALPNMLILNGKQHFEKKVKENNLNNDMAFAISDSGYLNNEMSLE